jgi:hypothetical protein
MKSPSGCSEQRCSQVRFILDLPSASFFIDGLVADQRPAVWRV